MNAKQLKAIQNVTFDLNRLCDGFEFTCDTIEGLDILMVSATNSINTRWYETSDFVLIFVGPQGGIKINKASSHIRKMLKLIK